MKKRNGDVKYWEKKGGVAGIVLKTLYDILRISRDADKQEILSAYRQRAKETHPDLGGDQDEFVMVNNAYSVLFNDEKRAQYDETGTYECDDVSNLVIGIILTLFGSAVDEYLRDPGIDVVIKTRDFIHQGIKNFIGKLEIFEIKMDKHLKLQDEISYEGESGDLLSIFLNQMIFESRKEIRSCNIQIEAGKLALKIMDDYRFNFGKHWLDYFKHKGWGVVDESNTTMRDTAVKDLADEGL